MFKKIDITVAEISKDKNNEVKENLCPPTLPPSKKASFIDIHFFLMYSVNLEINVFKNEAKERKKNA